MRVNLTCPQCGRSFDVKPSHAPKRRYCSVACMAAGYTGEGQPLAERFWAKVQKSSDPDGCWLWTGATYSNGYGHIGEGGQSHRTLSAHRVAWWLATGIWPKTDETVCHDCPDGDTRSCVRNDSVGVYVVDGIAYPRRGHLWLGNQPANLADMAAKGRGASGDKSGSRTHPESIMRGERNSQSKLTADQVRTIRTRYADGGVLQSTLADEYGLTFQTISNIVRRRSWSHL